ncbi:helix-turn-helix domain containing protein [Nannocystis sp. ILAH1]|uniref:TetR family transcriptional regulator n=1 Tax=unclassified Nannocystis TaxID=2627009 RepID=UPI0022715965|nr:helix-turn-helix domain containing protein [Nannocystis sp. ILAH1]MCY1065392.1 helix-turn-helix domain containing protein [Nannocystis sp. RBIL2]
MPRVTPEHTAARRRLILDAARAVFARKGTRAATIEDICAEAGISAGGIYTHFPSKAAIREAIHAEARAANRRFPAAIRAAPDPLAALQDMAGDMFKLLDAPELQADHRMSLQMHADAVTDPELAASYAEIHVDMMHAIRGILDEAVAGGRLPETLDTEYLAWTMVALYQGARVQKLLVPSLDTARLGQMVRRLLAGVLKG